MSESLSHTGIHIFLIRSYRSIQIQSLYYFTSAKNTGDLYMGRLPTDTRECVVCRCDLFYGCVAFVIDDSCCKISPTLWFSGLKQNCKFSGFSVPFTNEQIGHFCQFNLINARNMPNIYELASSHTEVSSDPINIPIASLCVKQTYSNKSMAITESISASL